MCEFYLFFQNKFFQINIRNIIPSSKNSHCNFNWNCVKCRDPYGENWPLGSVRSSFHEMHWVSSISAESGACLWTADRWLLVGKETRGRQEMVKPLASGPLVPACAPLQAQAALSWPPSFSSPLQEVERSSCFWLSPDYHCQSVTSANTKFAFLPGDVRNLLQNTLDLPWPNSTTPCSKPSVSLGPFYTFLFQIPFFIPPLYLYKAIHKN